MATPKARSVAHYDRFRRFYDLPDGRVFVSVTTILESMAKPALVPWAARVERELVVEAAASLWEDAPTTPKMSREAFIASLGNRLGKTRAYQKELAKATEIGSSLHALIEWNLRRELGQVVGPEPQVRDAALWAFMAWEDWRKEVKLKPRAIEQVVWSTTHEYAGTMDLLAEVTLPDMGTVLAVLDWKTGKAIWGEAHLQNTAYVHAMIEMGHLEPPATGLIVRLPKVESDPTPEFLPIPWERLEALFPVFLAVKKVWTWMNGEKNGAGTGSVAGKPASEVLAETVPASGPVVGGELAKHQLALLELVKGSELGAVDERDGQVFIWLPVAVQVRMGLKEPKEALPVALAELTASETKAIGIAFGPADLSPLVKLEG